MSLPSAQPAHDSPDVVPAGTGLVDTGAVTVYRRFAGDQPGTRHADFVLVDDQGHTFGHVYRTIDGYADGSWASHGPAAFSPGHTSLESAEDTQIAAYVSGALPASYQVDVDHTGLGIWEPVFAGETRVQSMSPIDAGVRAREIEAVYRGARLPGSIYRVTITCDGGRQVAAYTPDETEHGVPGAARL